MTDELPKFTRLKIAQNNLCYYCEREFGKGKRKPTREHLHRICDGGDASGDNIVLACEYCNSAREDVSPEVWKIICTMVEDNTIRRKKWCSYGKRKKLRLKLMKNYGINEELAKSISIIYHKPFRKYFYYRRKMIELYGKMVYTFKQSQRGE